MMVRLQFVPAPGPVRARVLTSGSLTNPECACGIMLEIFEDARVNIDYLEASVS